MEYEGEFVPGDHTVEEVKEYVDAHPEQKDNVRGSESENKNRSTLIAYLDHVPEDKANEGGPAADDVNAYINPGDVDAANPGVASNNDPAKTERTDFTGATIKNVPAGGGPERPLEAAPVDGDPTPGVPPQEPAELKAAQLKSWGASAEPVSWATNRDQPVISAIRAYNHGFGSEESVQSMLDITYPDMDLQASDVVADSAPLPDPSMDMRGDYEGLEPRGTGGDIPDDDNAANKVQPPAEHAGLTTADVPDGMQGG